MISVRIQARDQGEDGGAKVHSLFPPGDFQILHDSTSTGSDVYSEYQSKMSPSEGHLWSKLTDTAKHISTPQTSLSAFL